nr:uncharacterized protein LOC128677926 [Plodia interpunctella]
MPITCAMGTSGGKGNKGMFIERDKNVCAAGLPTAQPEQSVKNNLEHYLMQEEVDALIGDAIKPSPKVISLPPLRRPMPRDMRFAGSFSDGSLLINPPTKSKFQTAIDDIKESCYESYWNKQLGKNRDPTPFLPFGYDLYGTTAGKKTDYKETLYDVVMPKNPIPGDLPRNKHVAYQKDRNYCSSSFNPNTVFGMRSNIDKRGRNMKCCLLDDRIPLGTSVAKPMNTLQANLVNNKVKLGVSVAPNDNISRVPKGFAFGKSTELNPNESAARCLTLCDFNPDRIFF